MLAFLFNWRVWAVIFIAWFLYTSPSAAAAKVHQGLGVASNAFHSFGTFVNHL